MSFGREKMVSNGALQGYHGGIPLAARRNLGATAGRQRWSEGAELSDENPFWFQKVSGNVFGPISGEQAAPEGPRIALEICQAGVDGAFEDPFGR